LTEAYLGSGWTEFENLLAQTLDPANRQVDFYYSLIAGLITKMRGMEKVNVKVTLASKLSAEDCASLNLGYLDPITINLKDWEGREHDRILYVPKAGEFLYRLKEQHV